MLENESLSVDDENGATFLNVSRAAHGIHFILPRINKFSKFAVHGLRCARRHEPRIASNIWIGINSLSSSLIPEYAVNVAGVDVPSTVFAGSV